MTSSEIFSIARFIDHTLLKPEASRVAFQQLCQEARDYQFASVCVLPRFVGKCREWLSGCDVHVGTVIGFPLGAQTIHSKVLETQQAVEAGAQEIDMVVTIGALKDGEDDYILDEISRVVQTAGVQVLVKVILELGLLKSEEKVRGALLAEQAGAHFVKTSTGVLAGGATVEDVALLRQTVGDSMKVKASGGIRTLDQALSMIRAGADRLGTSSGVAIVKEAQSRGSVE